MSATNSDWSLVGAYAMPFLHAEVLTYLNPLRQGYGAVVPVLKSRPEPNHASHSKKCLPHIKQRLKPNDLNISRFYQDVRVEYVPEADIDRIDPDFLRFLMLTPPAI